MKTSVILSTYNGSEYIIELLDSLKAQTLQPDEVLIVDDCSSDNTVEIIKEYIHRYELIGWDLLVRKRNLGWKKSFADVLRKASGDVIFLCDQDDIWDIEKIYKMVNAFKENTDILLLVSNFKLLVQHGRKVMKMNRIYTENGELISKVVFSKHYGYILRPGCTMAVRKKIVPLFNLLWEPVMPHDALLWTIGSILNQTYLFKEELITRRVHYNNTSNALKHLRKEKIDSLYRILKVNEWFVKSNFCDKKAYKIVEDCSVWCDYRKKVIEEGKIRYWLKMWKYKDYYYSFKQYIGDLWYWGQCVNKKCRLNIQ